MKRGYVENQDPEIQGIWEAKRQRFNEYQQEMKRRRASRRPVKKKGRRVSRARVKKGRRAVKKRLSFKRRANGVKHTSQFTTSTITKSTRQWAGWAKRKLRDLRQIKRYVNHFTYRITGVNGYQSVGSTPLPVVPTSVPTVDPGTAAIAAVQKIWWEYISGQSQPNRNRYIYIESISLVYEIHNQNEWVTTLDIYDCVCRRDSNDSMEQAWEDGLAEGQKLVSLVPAGSLARQTYRVTPFMSNQFCQGWKVLRKHQVVLPAGTSHKHSTFYNIKKRINVDDFKGQSGIYKRGFTHGSLLVGYGKQASDFDNTQEIVAMKADYVVGVKMEIRFRIDDQENTDQNIVIQSLTNPSAVNAPINVNPATGQVDTNMATS